MLLPKLVTFFFLTGAWIQVANAENCTSIFGVLRQGQSARSAILQSPDGRSSAWSEATAQENPNVLYTTLYIHDAQDKQTRPAFRSDLTPDSQLPGFKNPLGSGSYDAYCPVDWSADSRFLLVDHTRGPQASDHLKIEAWVFDRATNKRQRINTTELIKTIERHAKTRQLKSSLYYLFPIGWESHAGRRVVFAALPPPGEEQDLGIWSAEMNGSKPKLLEEQSDKHMPVRFGKPGSGT